MLRAFDCAQGSEEWFKLRCGIPTSSEFDNIITAKGEISKSREKYLYRLAAERISKIPEATFQSEAMKAGKLMEAEARNYYSFAKKVKVTQVGFVLQEHPGYGCSPDGICGKPGSLEIKCPIGSTHAEYLYYNKLPIKYYVQTQGQLLVLGKEWLDFMSYYQNMKPLIVRVRPDKMFQYKLKKELERFCAELDHLVKRIK
jgi:predicted phage-related endonuclease